MKSLMKTVACTVEEVEIENDEGWLVPAVRATCSRCGHQTESFGTSLASVTRCLVRMRRGCPDGEHNFYAGSA